MASHRTYSANRSLAKAIGVVFAAYLGLSVVALAMLEGVHNQRMCDRAANPAMCLLAKDAGESDRIALAYGNGDYSR